MQREMLVLRSQFFEDVMGVQEAAFLNLDRQRLLEMIAMREVEGKMIMTINGYQAGRFEEWSIAALRKETGHLKGLRGTFTIVDGTPTNSPMRPENELRQVDVGGMQADPYNRDAVFQVASNFNALETTFAYQDIESQRLTSYVRDSTQGPFASISAAPGLVLRRYFIYLEGNRNATPAEWRQRTNRQINLLAGTPLPMSRAGYVQLSDVPFDPKDQEKHLLAMKVGYHGKVQVSHGFRPVAQTHFRINDPQQIVNQVFTAAADFGSTNGNLLSPSQPAAVRDAAVAWGKIIQLAAYEGTLRAAAAHGKKRVILTMIGGGAFRNDVGWIADAIEANKNFIMDSGLQVFLVSYARLPAMFADRMRKLAEATGGHYHLGTEKIFS